MSRLCTVVMYHYVRPIRNSLYPGIKGLEVDDFRRHIVYLRNNFAVISAEQLANAVQGNGGLPDNAAMVSFDDGYADHYDYAFPVLDEYGIPGIFFPPSECILHGRVLPVNKIHYVLASRADPNELVDRIDKSVLMNQGEPNIRKPSEYWAELAHPNRFDPAEIIYIKRMLQRDLPETLRNVIVDELFAEFVSSDEQAFAKSLYMTVDQVKTMSRHGMDFGSHGASHRWLNFLSPEEQADDITRSLQFLDSVGIDTSRWIMCYPYGGFNEKTLEIVDEKGAVAGFTASPAVADLDTDHPLLLPRLDANDIQARLGS